MANSLSRLLATLGSLTKTKGGIAVADGTDWANLGVGSDGQVLTADSAEATGLKWAAAAGGGWTFHEELTPSAVASVTTSAFAANPDEILVIGTEIDPASTSVRFECEPSGTWTYVGGAYNNASSYTTWTGTTDICMMTSSTTRQYRLHMKKWDSRDWWQVTGDWGDPSSGNAHNCYGTAKLTAGSMTTLTFRFHSGNITSGTIQVFLKA